LLFIGLTPGSCQQPVWKKAHGDNIGEVEKYCPNSNQDQATLTEGNTPAVDINATVEDQELQDYSMDAEPSSPPAHKPIKQVYLELLIICLAH
jgi:hypothetical protein